MRLEIKILDMTENPGKRLGLEPHYRGYEINFEDKSLRTRVWLPVM